MSIVHISGYDVEQVPIELIEPGDTVLTHLPDGSPYTFVVELKRFDIDKVAGTSKIGLQAARETDTHGVGLVATTEAPAGTFTHRVISQPEHRSAGAPRHQHPDPFKQKHHMTTGPDPNYRHPKCYANLHGGCSTKISGENYISHSLIKL
jgi:hypothetical protein